MEKMRGKNQTILQKLKLRLTFEFDPKVANILDTALDINSG